MQLTSSTRAPGPFPAVLAELQHKSFQWHYLSWLRGTTKKLKSKFKFFGLWLFCCFVFLVGSLIDLVLLFSFWRYSPSL